MQMGDCSIIFAALFESFCCRVMPCVIVFLYKEGFAEKKIVQR